MVSAVHAPGNHLGCPSRGTWTYPTTVWTAAHHSSMCHTAMAHRGTSHSSWRRKQAAPVPLWQDDLLSGVTWSTQYAPTYTVQHTSTPPPTHAEYNNYGYVLSFHNPPDHLTLRNVIVLLWINITRHKFTTIIHTSKLAHPKKLHSSRCKLGLYISHHMNICSKIRSVCMSQPSWATSFKG